MQEQKLFDIGNCVAQINRSLQSLPRVSSPPFVVDPRELLWGILSSLSNIRGGQSHLFPVLLENAGDIFSVESPSISNIVGAFPSTVEHRHGCLPFPSEHWLDHQSHPGEQSWGILTSTMPVTSVPNFLTTSAPPGVVFTQV